MLVLKNRSNNCLLSYYFISGIRPPLTAVVPMVVGSILCSGTSCELSLLLILSLASRVFLLVLRFSSLRKNQHFKIPIRSWTRATSLSAHSCHVPTLVKQSRFIYFIYLYCQKGINVFVIQILYK
jgi:hypothetical protein